MSTAYTEKTLSKGEEVLQIVEHNILVYIPSVIFALIAIATFYSTSDGLRQSPSWGMFFSFGIIALYLFLYFYTDEMVITNKRVISKRGIISSRTEELKIGKIESVIFDQSVLGRIFRFSTIRLSGTGTMKVTFKWVKDGLENKRLIDTNVDEYNLLSEK